MKTALAFSFLFAACICSAQEMQGPPQGQPPAIPQSAYAACSGKSQGEAVTDGQMSGTCEVGPEGQLALRPSGPPPNGQRQPLPGTSPESAANADMGAYGSN